MILVTYICINIFLLFLIELLSYYSTRNVKMMPYLNYYHIFVCVCLNVFAHLVKKVSL